MNGLLYIAFGEKFKKLAVQTIAYSRKYTDLPITILTNSKNREHLEKLNNVNVVYIEDVTANNRQYKTTMIDYTPYDKTIYLDVDSVIQRKGIETAFSKLDGCDLMCNIYGRWVGHIPLSYYRTAMRLLKVNSPINIYYGALIGFNKTENIKNFFKTWNINWKIIKNDMFRMTGMYREMPALACTIKKMNGNLKLKELNNMSKVFSWRKNINAIVQHEYGARFYTDFFISR